jgi:hypothetical protein
MLRIGNFRQHALNGATLRNRLFEGWRIFIYEKGRKRGMNGPVMCGARIEKTPASG